jgi:hypothetical protein
MLACDFRLLISLGGGGGRDDEFELRVCFSIGGKGLSISDARFRLDSGRSGSSGAPGYS